MMNKGSNVELKRCESAFMLSRKAPVNPGFRQVIYRFENENDAFVWLSVIEGKLTFIPRRTVVSS